MPLCPAVKIYERRIVTRDELFETFATPSKAIAQEDEAFVQPEPGNAAEGFDLWAVVGVIYLAGVALMITRSVMGICRVRAIIGHAKRIETSDGVEILLTEEDTSAFNYGGKIVVSTRDYAHYHQISRMMFCDMHHLVPDNDLSIVGVALAAQWFNPAMWLMRKKLILTHEYAADRGVVENGIDAKTYQILLISKIARRNGLETIVSHLRSSDLHKRIKTMKRTTSKWASLKLLAIIPLVGIALTAFASVESRIEFRIEYSDNPTTKKQLSNEKFHKPYQGKVRGRYGHKSQPQPQPAGVDRTVIPPSKHTGIDVVVSNDTIRAPYSGAVEAAEMRKDGSGNTLVISHGGGLKTTYKHLSKFLVDKGDKVEGGEPVAIVGSTGRSTGKHLHLECRVDGKLGDPEKLLPLN